MQLTDLIINKTDVLPLGSSIHNDVIRVSAIVDKDSESGVLLFPEDSIEPIKVPFPKDAFQGRIGAMTIKGLSNCHRYLLYSGERTFLDPYMKASEGYGAFGENTSVYSVFFTDKYTHKIDKPSYSFCDSIFYMLHVRGYTAHNSSNIKNKGTFKGLEAKLDYIKNLGVTSLILMPIYEFNEILSVADSMQAYMSNRLSDDIPKHIRELAGFKSGSDEQVTNKVNFWGYTGGYYYTPKASYAATSNPVNEFHNLIENIHKHGLEVILQFKFEDNMTSPEIIDVLRFWNTTYCIDGFQLIGSGLPIYDILKDPVLYGTKLLYDENIYNRGEDINPNHGHIDMGFLNDMRCFLKGDPNMAECAARRLRDADPYRHPVNTLARQDTMRLFDIVTYNEKHNNDNGENGRDGNNTNNSWNCGIEGPSKKKNIQELRIRQIKNALTMMFLSQGTPLLYGGDEFCNTQFGNNNPYNQDNATGYIKWSTSASAKEIYSYVRSLIDIRKAHASLRSNHMLLGRDMRSYGFPDISLHGKALYRPDLSPSSHTFGMLYYDKYFDENSNSLVYILYNMHWEEQELALPKLKENDFSLVLTSDNSNKITVKESISLAPRSVAVIEAELCE